jgi:hypothetical protein
MKSGTVPSRSFITARDFARCQLPRATTSASFNPAAILSNAFLLISLLPSENVTSRARCEIERKDGIVLLLPCQL